MRAEEAVRALARVAGYARRFARWYTRQRLAVKLLVFLAIISPVLMQGYQTPGQPGAGGDLGLPAISCGQILRGRHIAGEFLVYPLTCYAVNDTHILSPGESGYVLTVIETSVPDVVAVSEPGGFTITVNGVDIPVERVIRLKPAG